MSSNGETLSEKPKGVDADSFPGPIKPTGTSYVSSGLSNGDPHSKKTKSEASVSSGLIKPSGKTGVSSGLSIGVPNSKNPDCTKTGVSLGVRGKAAVSSRAKGKAIVSAKAVEVMSFKDVKFGAHGCELRFRLIHLWEARNVVTKTLIGLEMFLIDQEGFIPAGRIDTYLPHMKVGGIYRLNKDSSVCFPEDRFRFHGYEEFDAACDLRRDLYDYVGHIKLVNGQVLNDSLVLDDAEIASSRRVLLHVQTHDGPVMKLYLWDKAASDFSGKFKASGGAASVILVTTLNPKRFGGVLTLSSMTSSRVFLDSDVQATRDYLTWLNSNMDVADIVSAEVVTKTETVTIGELFSYMKQEAAKVAWFECIATVGDVVHGSRWYYIGCGVCHTKATKGPTTLMCKKCGKSDIVGVAQYLAKISVYDNDDQACFVLLGDAGQELTGKKASELVDSYFETRKFIVKVSTHNLTGKTQSLTVTKVLIPEDPEIEGNVENNGIAEDGPSTRFEESGGERVKRTADNVEAEDSKRAKCG
ncbi:BnaA02g18210D [Brassica napus]|uniref:BnaA02g18210D protein n=1 Tax=Brassica napus TaxID=3708 RepID=A0A078HNC6_BRANA|nr:BnaA02g18210D [Brassica napus]